MWHFISLACIYLRGFKAAAAIAAGLAVMASSFGLGDSNAFAESDSPESTQPAVTGGALAPLDGAVAGLNFYESFRESSCPNEATCLLTFARVPVEFMLRITRINCVVQIEHQRDWTVIDLGQGPPGGPQFQESFGVAALNPDAPVAVFTLNAETSTFIEGGKRPRVVLNGPSPVPTLEGRCKLSGELHAPSV